MHPITAALVRAWDWSYVDFEQAFEGMSLETLHCRPNGRIISIAEIAAHTVYSEASIVLRYLLGVPKEGWGEDIMLKDPYGWPPSILEGPPSSALLRMGVEDVRQAWLGHHRRFVSALEGFDLPPGHRFEDEWSPAAPDVETRLRFAAYHVAYHIGQIYTTRHLLG